MTSLEHGRFCDEVVNQTGLLVATVEGADLSATVPTAPDWALSDLVRHVGGNLRSLETAVRTGEAVTEPARQIPGHGGPPGDDPAELFAWLSRGRRPAARPRWGRPAPRSQAQMWTIRWPTAAWARRAANDLLIHRADAAGTVGAAYTVAPDLAADALDEFLDLVSSPEVAGASPDAEAGDPGPSGTIHLHATDTGPEVPSEWLVELASPTFTWRHAHEKASVAVRGPLADVLRVACRRLPPDAEGIELLGDRAVLDAWLERVVAPASPAQRWRPRVRSSWRRSRLVGRPIPGSRRPARSRGSRGGGGGLLSTRQAAASSAPTRCSIGRTTSTTRSRSPTRTRTVSSALTVDAGLARTPFTCTCPARQAWAAPDRVLVSRTAHSQRSTRTLSIRSWWHGRAGRP